MKIVWKEIMKKRIILICGLLSCSCVHTKHEGKFFNDVEKQCNALEKMQIKTLKIEGILNYKNINIDFKHCIPVPLKVAPIILFKDHKHLILAEIVTTEHPDQFYINIPVFEINKSAWIKSSFGLMTIVGNQAELSSNDVSITIRLSEFLKS